MQSGELKNLIWYIIHNTDEVDVDGKVVPIKTIKKDYFRGLEQIKKAIKNQIGLQIEKINTSENGEQVKEIIACSQEEYQNKYSGYKILGEFHTSEDIVFSDKMKAALRFYYAEHESIPHFANEESVDELEAILADN